ncbi:MAG: M20/M25/M40 family metallo-hydrolase, partial [Verrucomicrobiae bacterium]|nr:M20/M25/M40 family metallo-hydrolase [Verrucomicrobiae bacterium]
ELIAIPSVNPAFLPTDDPRTGEAAVADFLSGVARKAGLDVTLQPVAPGRANLIARLEPPGPVRRRILLAPHLDTVGLPALDELLDPRIARGRLYGRGACDTKGCVAAMMSAIEAVARSGTRPQETEIVFLGLVDEENGQLGSRHYARHGATADLAIVGEPTRLEVVSAHKGDVWLELRTRGRSAHGATPHLGRNAVLGMARVVEALETTYAEQLKRRSHPLLGSPTVNVGSIRGGTQPNIVPEECVITVDRRTLPGETEATVRREIREVLGKAGAAAQFANLRLSPCPALETDPRQPLVQALCRAAGRRRTVGVHYFCDAAPLSEGGTPAVVFGPGDIAQAHTRDEWISLESLDRGTAILERFLRGLD